MKTSCFKRIAVVLAVWLGVVGGAWAETPAPSEATAIRVTADRMLADNNDRFAEFAGNVRAVQGTTVITADTLRIYLGRASEAKTERPAETADGIQRLVASGRVTILFDGKTATCDQAEYLTETRVLVLTGTQSTVVSADNTVSGSKITLYRADGRVTVEGGATRRVEAQFYSDQKGLD